MEVSKVECKNANERDHCLNGTGMVGSPDGCIGDRDRGSAPRRSRERSSPSPFLVPSVDNVNAELSVAGELATVWDYLEYKGRVGKTNIVLNRIDDPSRLKIVQAKDNSRYFEEGRLRRSRRIRRRLGKYERAKGLMLTLTYDPKRVGRQEAWSRFGQDVRRFINAVNQYRKRQGWRRLHYMWVVEVQKGTGYPHVHMFFPNLKWLAPYSIINGNWRDGRTNLESPKSVNASCAGYISKYLRKNEGWDDLHLALLWKGRSRMYGFSRGFMAAMEKKAPEWARWAVLVADNLEVLEKNLEDGGMTIERGWPPPSASANPAGRAQLGRRLQPDEFTEDHRDKLNSGPPPYQSGATEEDGGN